MKRIKRKTRDFENSKSDVWEFVGVFHNLPVTEPIENGFVAIVPYSDPRVAPLSNHADLKKFVSRFTDQFGVELDPGIMICKAGLPIRSEGFQAFKNILALSSIPLAFAKILDHNSQFEYLKFSEYFEPYVFSLTKESGFVGYNLPTGMQVDEIERFHGQSSPELVVPSEVVLSHFDLELLTALFSQWRRHFISKTRRAKKHGALFNSLQMAFRASAAPIQHRGDTGDLGTQLALWVSAHEILAHDGHSDLSHVLAQLGKSVFQGSRLGKRCYKIKIGGTIRRVNLLQKLYCDIYKARNYFLHGNPINEISLFAFKKANRYLLNYFAPLIYRFALYSSLNIWKRNPDPVIHFDDWSRRSLYEKAILKARENRSSIKRRAKTP